MSDHGAIVKISYNEGIQNQFPCLITHLLQSGIIDPSASTPSTNHSIITSWYHWFQRRIASINYSSTTSWNDWFKCMYAIQQPLIYYKVEPIDPSASTPSINHSFATSCNHWPHCMHTIHQSLIYYKVKLIDPSVPHPSITHLLQDGTIDLSAYTLSIISPFILNWNHCSQCRYTIHHLSIYYNLESLIPVCAHHHSITNLLSAETIDTSACTPSINHSFTIGWDHWYKCMYTIHPSLIYYWLKPLKPAHVHHPPITDLLSAETIDTSACAPYINHWFSVSWNMWNHLWKSLYATRHLLIYFEMEPFISALHDIQQAINYLILTPLIGWHRRDVRQQQ